MGNIKNIMTVFFICTSNAYGSDNYLFKFHTELPLHYRAEMFLLDLAYQSVTSKRVENQDNEITQIFERMEYVISRLSFNALAQSDYQKDVITYKNKVIAFKNIK